MSCEFCDRFGGPCIVCTTIETPQGEAPRPRAGRPVERIERRACDLCNRVSSGFVVVGLMVVCHECCELGAEVPAG